ncbi:MAG: hypothetical protein ACRDPE_14185 [Solirubrobacterales bacterium]
MSESAREVLLVLAGLAGTVMIAALVTPFFAARSRPRNSRSPVALFEGMVSAVVIISAMVTAETALVAVYDNEPVSADVVSHIALPLAFGVILLIVLALASRLVDSPRDILGMAPWTFLVLFVAIAGGFAVDVNLSDRHLLNYVFGVLVAGAFVGWGSWRYELRLAARAARKRREETIKRWRGDLRRDERELAVALPGSVGSGFTLRCWAKKELLLLDEACGRQLSQTVERRWQALEEGLSILPPDGPVLTEVRVIRPMRKPWLSRLEIRVSAGEGVRGPIKHSIDGRGGLFDVTEVGLV